MNQEVNHPLSEEYIDSLDALRGLAALAVCWFHMTMGGNLVPPGLMANISSYGHLGVAVFFVISGFVIPWSLRNESACVQGYARFMGKRMLRLHPPFLVACLLVIFLNWLSMKIPGYQGVLPDPYLPSAMETLGRDMCYISGLLGKEWTIIVSWTLALEVQFYLLAGLAILMLDTKNKSWLTGALLLGGCMIGFLLPNRSWVFAHLPLFVLGWSVAWMKFSPKESFVWVVALIAVLSVVFQNDLMTASVAFFTLLIIRFFPQVSAPGLTWLGSISYSLYLLHVPIGGRIINLGMRWIPEGYGRLGLAVVATLVSLCAAWVFYKLVEQPCHRWCRQIFQRRSLRSSRFLSRQN